MNRSRQHSSAEPHALRRVLILADESAAWQVAGLRQLDRLVFTLHDFVLESGRRLHVSVWWQPEIAPQLRWLPNDSRVGDARVTDCQVDDAEADEPVDLIVSTRLCLFRHSVPQLIAAISPPIENEHTREISWDACRDSFEHALAAATRIEEATPWRYLRSPRDISPCERAFLRQSGKSQDGLVSRHINRPISRTVSRWLLRWPLAPNTWSILVFSLPLLASLLFLRGTSRMFLAGAAIYQLYSILDGCDGEIARAKFLQSEFGRRLDSFLDLAGNMLLVLCLGFGLARQWNRAQANGWIFLLEGIAAAICIALSEGIVFARRSRVISSTPTPKWNAALYQRHHEFLERSGFLVIGEKLAWWLIQLTKRDMAMLAFLFLAAINFPTVILHLVLGVSGISAALAGNAFLRPPAPVLPQQAS